MWQSSQDLRSVGKVSWPAFVVLLSGTLCLGQLCSQSIAISPPPKSQSPLADTARNTLAWTFAKLIEEAIPEHYEKKKDWGRRKNITIGLRNDGLKLERRKKAVKHGVWKHYTVDLVDPEQNLDVQIENLHTLDDGRAAFTLILSAKLDLWGRVKVYQYGVHLIAVEIVGQTEFDLALDCEVGVGIVKEEGRSVALIDPSVSDARLKLREFRLDRISNAKGPLVKELGDEIEDIIVEKLRGPKLTAKINRAIDKKRDRLKYTLPKFLDSSWWPLANLPAVQDALQHEDTLIR